MITFDHFSYTYPNATAPAVSDVSLTIQQGEFVLLTGPSGSGKSTLLRAINGLVPHFSGGTVSGRVKVDGLDPIKLGPTRLSCGVGFVFQNPEAQAVLDTVETEIVFGLEQAGIPAGQIHQCIQDTLTQLNIPHLRHRRLETLSGGERQKVAIATALALQPKILILDEPTSQLDEASAESLLQTLIDLKDTGLTIILSEHRLKRVWPYATRVIALGDRGSGIGDRVLTSDDQLPATSYQLPATSHSTLHIPHSTLYIENLHYAYNDTPILNGINLTIRPGECVALMGSNGAGKTTLLKCVVGLIRPGQGHVYIDRENVSGRGVAEICRHVAYLPQNPDDLLFAETVQDELLATLKNHDQSARKTSWLKRLFGDRGSGIGDQKTPYTPHPTLHTLLDNLGLTDYATAYPRDLSVGQRQRVALGAVMVTQPKLLLLDEPTRGLDHTTKQQLVTLWRDWLDKGMALLLVTHDAELAEAMAHRVVNLTDGRIV